MIKPFVRAAVAFVLLLSGGKAWPQLVLGQYEDEAPLRSWNTLGNPLAPSVACGGAGIAFGWDASAALINPALAASLPRLTASISGSYVSASLMRYSILNTGVLSTPRPVTDRSYGLDFGGIALRQGKWAFAASADLSENYGRPRLEFQAEDQGVLVYSIAAAQTGWLRSFNLTAARTLAPRLSAGVTVRVLRGEIERTTAEDFASDGVLIDDSRRRTLTGFAWSAGLTYSFSGRLSAGLIFQGPFTTRSTSRSLLEYRAPAVGTDIRIAGDEKDRLERPWAAGAGISWRPAERLRIVSDVRFFKWSAYEVTVFGEPKKRDFRDVWTAAAGAEYSGSYRLFGRNVVCPLRIGFALDPQPMKSPGSTYAYLTFGTGLALGRVRLDIGVALGRESGSGDGLAARRAVLTLSYDPGSERP